MRILQNLSNQRSGECVRDTKQQASASNTPPPNGFISFDALFSTIPALLIILLLVQVISDLTKESQAAIQRQQVFDKLVSIADYTVKSGLVRRDSSGDVAGGDGSGTSSGAGTGIRYPNWIDADKISAVNAGYTESLRQRSGLSQLYLGLDAPDVASNSDTYHTYSICIYRIVVVGDKKAIRKLYVCGE